MDTVTYSTIVLNVLWALVRSTVVNAHTVLLVTPHSPCILSAL